MQKRARISPVEKSLTASSGTVLESIDSCLERACKETLSPVGEAGVDFSGLNSIFRRCTHRIRERVDSQDELAIEVLDHLSADNLNEYADRPLLLGHSRQAFVPTHLRFLW